MCVAEVRERVRGAFVLAVVAQWSRSGPLFDFGHGFVGDRRGLRRGARAREQFFRESRAGRRVFAAEHIPHGGESECGDSREPRRWVGGAKHEIGQFRGFRGYCRTVGEGGQEETDQHARGQFGCAGEEYEGRLADALHTAAHDEQRAEDEVKPEVHEEIIVAEPRRFRGDFVGAEEELQIGVVYGEEQSRARQHDEHD